MRQLRIALARFRGDDAGFTLIELLVTVIMLVVILGAASTVLIGVNRQSPNDVERGKVIGQAEAGISRMTRDLRAGWAATGSSLPTAATNVMDLVVPDAVNGTIRVKYDCTVSSTQYPGEKQCVRYWGTDTSTSPTGNASIVVDDVSNDENSTDSGYTPVFTPSTSSSPTYYSVEIQVPAKGSRAQSISTYAYQVTLTDGIYLRNNSPTNRAAGGQ
jgi:prepilin-type N-terminal cleavage/methylation domain-containing protein